MWSPDEGKTIKFRYHRTDMVEYTESTLKITFWDSQSSCTFVDGLTPNGFSARLIQGSMYVNRMRSKADPLLFNRVGSEWVVDPETVMPQYQVSVDRKILSAVQKQLAPFFKYREARAALSGDRLPTGTMRPLPWLIQFVKSRFDLPDQWPDLYMKVAHVSSRVILNELVAQNGGVRSTQLPIGILPKKSVYDGLRSV